MDIDSATDFYPLGDNILIQGGFEWMQGVACFEGSLCVTSDDGDADENAPDTNVQGGSGNRNHQL